MRVLAAGVALPDVMAREGVHPETPRAPFTPGWELVGVVDRVGAGVSGAARQAHELLAEGGVAGKLVLVPTWRRSA